MLIVSKKVKELLKQQGLRCSDEGLKAIDEELKKICLKAGDNVLADGLKTLRPAHVPKLDIFLDDSKKTI